MAEKLNILLVVAEALRVDSLGCYGGSGSASPSIDGIASSGAVAESFFCAATPLHAAWGALITGMHPVNLGMASPGGGAQLLPGITVAHESFLSAGYTTCTFDNMRRAVHWFGSGSEYYIDPGVRHGRAATPAETNFRVIPWLRSHRQEPFLVTIRYSHPSQAGESVGSAANDEFVAAVDARIGELMAALSQLQLSQKTLVAVAGAAGDAGLRESSNHVPLVLRCPGMIPPGTRFNGAIQTQDLAPTLLEAAGLNAPSNLDGASFWKTLRGEAPWRERESLYAIDCATQPQRWSLRKAGFKLIATINSAGEVVERSLYSLASDPREEHNLVGPDSSAADSMTTELVAWRAQRLQEWANMEELLGED